MVEVLKSRKKAWIFQNLVLYLHLENSRTLSIGKLIKYVKNAETSYYREWRAATFGYASHSGLQTW